MVPRNAIAISHTKLKKSGPLAARACAAAERPADYTRGPSRIWAICEQMIHWTRAQANAALGFASILGKTCSVWCFLKARTGNLSVRNGRRFARPQT